MRRSLLTAKGNPYPILLDDFEVNDLATKWPNRFSGFTRSVSSPPAGTACMNLDTQTVTGGVTTASTACAWYSGSNNPVRGDIVSCLIRGNSSAPQQVGGVVLGGVRRSPTSPDLMSPQSGVVIEFMFSYVAISKVISGTATSLATNSLVGLSAGTAVLLRCYWNPQTHPTDPGKIYVEALNPSTLTSYGSVSTVLDGPNEPPAASGFALHGYTQFKQTISPLAVQYDNVKIEGKT